MILDPSPARADLPWVSSGAMTNFQQAQYNNRIVACIRPHITFNTPAGAKRGMYVAKFDVRLLKNGQKAVPPRMISSSGLKAFRYRRWKKRF